MVDELSPKSIHFRNTGKIKLQCNLHYILPSAEPGSSRSAARPIEQMSPYFWSCWRHWLHRLWPKWQHFCASSPALLLELSGEGWLGSKPQSCTCRQVLEDRSWHHFLEHGPRLFFFLIHNRTRNNKWEMSFGKQISCFSADF